MIQKTFYKSFKYKNIGYRHDRAFASHIFILIIFYLEF
jgi:hypothetical protein